MSPHGLYRSSSSPSNTRPSEIDGLLEFETRLGVLSRAVRILPAITAKNSVAERARLRQALARAELLVPRFEYPAPRFDAVPMRALDRLREQARAMPCAQLYLDKLDELELDLSLLANIGNTRVIRPLAARRFGNGNEVVETPDGSMRLAAYARRLVEHPVPPDEARVLPAEAPGDEPSLARLVREVADHAGLDVTVRVEPTLAAGAATGDRTVFLADRHFGSNEAMRLAVHEVLGHLTSAANGRAQPLRLLEWGTAQSFADQEGVALYLEAQYGVLDHARSCTLGARVLAAELFHRGASFGETALCLYRDYGFSETETIATTERAYRGGGVARDVSYLLGLLRVRHAIETGLATLDELRVGRVSVRALPQIRELAKLGLARPSRYRANFSRSFFSTSSGTMPCKSPPRAAASLINVELT